MLKLHTRRNTTYQCTEITDIIHGVLNSGCAAILCKELVCMTRMNVEYTFEQHVHMPCLNGKTCPHENTFCEIGEKLSENAHHVCSGYAYICYRRAVHYFWPN